MSNIDNSNNTNWLDKFAKAKTPMSLIQENTATESIRENLSATPKDQEENTSESSNKNTNKSNGNTDTHKGDKKPYKPVDVSFTNPSLSSLSAGAFGVGEVEFAREKALIKARESALKSAAKMGHTDAGIAKHRMPLICNTCYAAEQCPAFKNDSVCAFKDEFAGYDTRDPQAIIAAVENLVSIYGERANRAVFFEKVMDGGYPNVDTTNLLEGYISQLNSLADTKRALGQDNLGQPSVSIQATGSNGVDILAQIFAQTPKMDEEIKVIEVEPDDNNDELDNQMDAQNIEGDDIDENTEEMPTIDGNDK